MDKENTYCIDVFTPQKERWMDTYSAKKVNGKNGAYFTLTVDKNDVKKVLRKCKPHGTRFYEKCWARSNNYRKNFLDNTKGPYVCSYCGKPLSTKYMVVDHIIPVEQTKKSAKARRKLKRRGITDVNDIRNLTASCFKCNKRKADKMGFWLIKAKHGKNKRFRVFCKTVRIVVIIAIIIFIFWLLHFNGIF